MQVDGLLGTIAVGKGKALLSLLAPVVMRAQRPVLLIPAQLREQTRNVLATAKKNWKVHTNLKVVAYSELSLEKNADLLFKLKPDLIVADEAHALKNKKSGRTKRVVRYMKEFPDTKFVALSGSIARRSLRDYAHISDWCLKEGSPLPNKWREQNDWADAIDMEVDPKLRVEPGALERFCEEGENHREGYRRRFIETRGIIASGEEELAVGLQILRRDVKVPDSVDAALRELRSTWETPGGDYITEAADLWRFGREIASGFYYKWDPAPPKDWARARKAWKRYVADTLKNNRRNLDTELQVWNDAQKRDIPPFEWADWAAWKDKFKPNVVPVWIDDFLMKDAANWLANNEGIAWTEHKATGEALAQLAGVPYFGAGSKASKEILDATGPIVASIQAHGTGKNLQRYSKNLVISAPSSGTTWEQMLGRTHRHGQQADTVTVETYVHTQELLDSITRALTDAVYLEETLGTRQKLLYADIGIENVRE